MVKNLFSNAGDKDLIPGQGTKIPHAMGQLNLHAVTTEPKHHNQREGQAPHCRARVLQQKIPHATTKA